MQNNELKHYGVLGMKWGIRRARKAGKSYNYQSMGQKKYSKKLDKAKKSGASSKKIDRINKKLDVLKARDRNRQYYAEKTNLGKAVAKQLIMGPFGAGNYNRMRSSGAGRLGSFMVSNWITGTVGYPATLLYSRHREKSAARRDIAKNN